VISDDDVEKALHWLVSNAESASSARANRIYLEEYKKTVLALEMKSSGENTSAAQEREAYISTSYRDHLIALQEAVREDEKIRWLGRAAEAKIEAWRTLQSNARAQGKIG
jgi:hypothetical protein